MKRVAKVSFAQGQLMLWILVGSLLAFGAMFVFFRISGVTLATVPRKLPLIAFMPTARQDPLSLTDARYIVADVFDPSLMSLPSLHGFSSGLWRRRIEAKQRNLDWNQEPAYLDAKQPEPLRSLLEPVPLAAAALSASEKNPALSEEPENEMTGPAEIVNASVFRVLGPLEDRGVIRAPELPVLASPVPVRAVQVRVGVGPDGLVRYALLDRSCGSEVVDAQAVLLARQFRFEATQSGDSALVWGIVRFLWATQGSTPTNMASAALSP
jgi:hypothetical protein